MVVSRIVRWLLLFSPLAALAFASASLPAGAQDPPHGVDVRLAARANADGSVTVGLQYQLDYAWSNTDAPERRTLPGDTPIGVWRASSAVTVPVRQAQVQISTTRSRWSDRDGPVQFVVAVDNARATTYCGDLALRLGADRLEIEALRADCSRRVSLGVHSLQYPRERGSQALRILARHMTDGGVELALQRRVGGAWEAMRQPARAIVPELVSPGQWFFTSSIALPAPRPTVDGELRRGVTIGTANHEFELTVDGVRLTSRCGFLRFSSFADTILVDTYDDACVGEVALATLCDQYTRAADCDLQQNRAYEWETRQPGVMVASRVALSRVEAQEVVDAIWSDYLPRRRAPQVRFTTDQRHGHFQSGTQRIVLGTDTQNLAAVIHELGHALVDAARVRGDPGHGGWFTAMLLQLWDRHLPLVDVDAARADAAWIGLAIAERAPLRAVSARAHRELRALLCDDLVADTELCGAFAGEALRLPAGGSVGSYVGYGSRGDDLWWGTSTEENGGNTRSYLAKESQESSHEKSIARLSIECNASEELEVDIWWRGNRTLPSELAHRFGVRPWQTDRWRTITGGRWGDDRWTIHRAIDASALLHEMLWHANSDLPLSVRYEYDGQRHVASFNLKGVFHTPVQGNLVTCGGRSVGDPDAQVIDRGNFGSSFWWSAYEDDGGEIRTSVVQETSAGSRIVRMQIECEDGELAADFWWAVESELDWTVRYRLNGGPVSTVEWTSGSGTWGDRPFMVVWPEHAEPFIAELAWAAQDGGELVIETYARDGSSQRYTATFDLDGLFDTPVQRNLARCGR